MRLELKQHLKLSSLALLAGMAGCTQAQSPVVDNSHNTVYLNGQI